MKGIAFQFDTAHVDVGPTLTLRFAPNANYKRYKGLPTLVNRSHPIMRCSLYYSVKLQKLLLSHFKLYTWF